MKTTLVLLAFIVSLALVVEGGFRPLGTKADFIRNFNGWKSKYVRNANPGLRVIRNNNNDDTVSEGIAYGMLIAVVAEDKPLFDGLWEYGKAKLKNPPGCMSWQINANGQKIGIDCATDAEEDMAWSLMKAYEIWGDASYQRDGKAMIATIRNAEVDTVNSNTRVLKNGDTWGGRDCTNPSYFCQAYYKEFKDSAWDGNAQFWNSLTSTSYTIMERSMDSRTGLIKGWTNLQGGACNHGKNQHYDWDSTRIPFRLAMDAAWYNDADAIKICEKMNSFVGMNPSRFGECARDAASPNNCWNNGNVAFVSPAACCATIDSATNQFRSDIWNYINSHTAGGGNGDYFADILHVMALGFMTGTMKKLGGSGAAAPTTPPPPTPQPTTPPPPVGQVVYADSLQNGFYLQSWGSDRDEVTNQKKFGSKSLKWQPKTSWAGLKFVCANDDECIDRNMRIEFWIKSTETFPFKMGMYRYGNVVGGAREVRSTNGQTLRNAWRKYAIHVADISSGQNKLQGFMMQRNSPGNSNAVVYVDQIELVPATAARAASSAMTFAPSIFLLVVVAILSLL